MKKCYNSLCEIKEPQPISNFYKNKKKFDGLSGYCKKCQADAISRSYYKAPEKWSERQKENRKRDRAKTLELQRKCWLRREYGITVEEYNDMFTSQGGVCKICRKHVSTLGRGLNVDHCHRTGRIRGLLCGQCNRGLGFFYDNVEYLESSIKYLKGEL